MTTALSVYYSNQASATLATGEALYTTSGAPSVATPKTQLDNANGFGELIAKGTTTTWAALGAIGAPTGKGMFLDASALDGQQLVAGAWSANVRTGLNTSGYAANFDLYVRAYKYSGGTYTQILSMVLAGNAFSGSTQSTYALSGTTASATNFATGDKLYIDIWLNISGNTSVSGQQLRLNSVSTDTTGFTGNTAAMVATPGYQVNSSTNYNVLITEQIASAYAESSVQGSGTNAVTERIASAYAESSLAGSGSNAITEQIASAYAESGATASAPTTNYTVAITEQIASAKAESSAIGSGNVGVTEQLNTAFAEASAQGAGSNAVTESIASASAEAANTTGVTTGILEALASASAEASSTQGSYVNITEQLSSAYAESGFMASAPPVIYTNPTLAITIAGQPVVLRDDNRFELDDSIGTISTFLCTIGDLSGTQHFKRGMQITISDSARGTLYTGFVMSSVETNYIPQTYIESYVSCVDNQYLVDKRTYPGPEYVNQYAGAILADQLNYLSAEGITAQYASLRETTQAQLALGTLSNVVSSTNQGNGDLELASAGTIVSHSEDLTTGTLTNMQNAGSTLTLQSIPALKLTGNSSQGQGGGSTNNFAYVELSSVNVALASGDYLQYEIWISSTSPQIMAGVDGICSDGTNLRDVTTPGFMNDQNGLWMHPKTDLSGYANDQWYTRQIVLSNVSGKTLSKVTVALEGNTNGNYTAYFRNVKLYTSSGGVKQTFFATTLGSVGQANTILSNSGYTNVALVVVTSYQQSGIRVSTATSITSVGIVKSSLMSWQATVPTGTTLIEEVSVDYGATWQACTRSQPFLSLLPGTNVSGYQIATRQRMMLTGTSPEVSPVLSSQIWSIAPSYNASVTGLLEIDQQASDFNAGSNNNIQVNGDNQMSLRGVWRTWDDASVARQTYFGMGGMGTVGQQANVTVTGYQNEGVAQLDFAGSWQNFIAEIDCSVSSLGDVSFCYRTTNQGTGKNTMAYSIQLNPSSITLGYGANNGSSSGQAYTSLQAAPTNLTGTNLKIRMKVVVSGSSHRIYLDDVLYINVTDSTYTSSGKFGLRFVNTTAGTTTYSAFFDNFGVMSSLTGYHKVGPLSISGLSTIGNSLVLWDADIPPAGGMLVETSFDNSTWQTCTNGSPIPQLPPGMVNNNTQLYIRTTLNTGNASASSIVGRDGNTYLTPTVHGITIWAVNQINAKGNRIGPVLSLGNIGRIGSTLAAWNALTPPNTSLGIDTRVDGGSWTDVSTMNGGTVPGLGVQPLATIDQYTSNTSTYRTGGSIATWAGDSTNDRMVATGGSKALYINNVVNCGDVSMTVDMDYSDTGGWVWHYSSTSSYYECVVQDGSAIGGGAPDTIALFSIKSGTRTQLLSVPIVFNRLEKHRFVTTMAGNTITTIMDGVTLWNYSDGLALYTGKCGLRNDGGTARTYQLYMQPLGDNAYTHTFQMRQRLATTDPTVSPQVLDTTLAAFGNSIAPGALIPKTAYQNKYISSNIDDLAKQSNYWWYVDKNKQVSFQPRTAVLAPWIASDNPGDFLNANITMTNQSDLYHNRHIVTNVLQTTSINESRIGDGFTQSWTFSYQWASAPSILVNEVPALIGIKGVDTGKQFYYAVGDPTITEDPSQPVYDASVEIEFAGTGQYLTTATADNLAAQATLAALENSSGIVEFVEDGKGISYAAGLAKAQAGNAQYSVLGMELQADTRRIGLAPGQLLTVYLSAFACYGTLFLIRSVKTHIGQEFSGYQPTMTIDAVSGSEIGDWSRLYLKQ